MKQHSYKVEWNMSRFGSHPIPKINDYFLHSQYHPVKEAERLVPQPKIEAKQLYILFGYGAGYIADVILSTMRPDDGLFIFEPNASFFNEVKNKRNVIQPCANVCVQVGISVDLIALTLKSWISQFNGNVEWIASPNYEKLYVDEYKAFDDSVKRMIMYSQIERNTVLYFYKEWHENFFTNLKQSSNAIPLQSLQHCTSVPVIIAASGPSLKKQLPLLRQIRNDILLICAGTTVNALLAEGIQPDIVVAIDGSQRFYEHFTSVKNRTYTLAYILHVHRHILREHEGRKILFHDSALPLQLKNFVQSFIGEECGTIMSGPSVANFALQVGLFISKGPIALIGQDLAYTNNQTHVDTNLNAQTVREDDKNTLYVEGWDGEQVKTSYSLASMKEAFEIFLQQSTERDRIKNCTEGGARIKHIDSLAFHTFIDRYISETNEPFSWNKIMEGISYDRDFQQYKETIQQKIRNYEKAKELAKEALRLLRLDKQLSRKTIKAINKIDEKLKPLTEDALLSFYLVPLLEYLKIVYREEEQASVEKSYQMSIFLYESTAHAAEKTMQSLTQFLKDGMI